MANRSKAKGTRAETNLRKLLETNGFTARRQALSGAEDMGDLEVYPPDSLMKYIIEVKAGKQTSAPNRKQIEDWCCQAVIEAAHAGGSPVLVVMRYHRDILDADVYIPHEKSRDHWYLEDWINSHY